MARVYLILTLCVVGTWLAGCTTSAPPAPSAWSIAIHGGAGTLDRDAPAAEVRAYREALNLALRDGAMRLARGEAAVDVCQAVVEILENDPKFNAGVGAALTADGTHELDAAIMDGATLRCGAVAGVKTVRNPIGLARLVMDRTRHVLLTADGAEQFATEMKVTRVPNTHFDTPRRRAMWDEWKAKQVSSPGDSRAAAAYRFGTVGCVALDAQGRLAAATSTGGLTGKRWGRVGDAPVIGAGTYASAVAAVSCTGTGEEFIRHAVARTIAARMELAGESVDAASRFLVFKTLKPDDGGVIAMDRAGRVAMPYSSDGMYRGQADSSGVFAVRIWED